jgi:hypothetical protein
VFRWMAGVLESQLEEMAVELAGVYRKTLGGYERLTERDVQRCTRAVLRVVVAQLRSGERPGEREREELLALAGGWAEAGLDVDTTARAFQIGARHLIGVVREQVAQDDAAAVEAFSASVDLAWEWSLLSGEVLSEVQRERTLRQARRDVNLRAEFLRDLAGGRVSPERLADAADAYGLDLELPYVTTCALAASSAVASRLEVELRFSGATDTHRVVLATNDGELLALCPRTPTASQASTLATGPPALLSDAAASFTEARHVLETATAFHRTGVVGLAALGGLALVTANDGLAQRLDQERFRGLNDGVADIEHTMLTYLEQGQNVEATAQVLHVHGNTVRYRLVRFRELTHLEVRDTRDLVLTWWLLNWRQAHDRKPGKASRTGEAATDGARSITVRRHLAPKPAHARISSADLAD